MGKVTSSVADCDGVPLYGDDPWRSATNGTVVLDVGGNEYLVQRDRVLTDPAEREVLYVSGERLMYMGPLEWE
jgi:hypothetical protein